jgi:hypothetical protein
LIDRCQHPHGSVIGGQGTVRKGFKKQAAATEKCKKTGENAEIIRK